MAVLRVASGSRKAILHKFVVDYHFPVARSLQPVGLQPTKVHPPSQRTAGGISVQAAVLKSLCEAP